MPPEFDPTRLVPDPSFSIPDIVGICEGWRTWTVASELPRYGAAPKLYSVTKRGYYWTPRQACVAELCVSCGDDAPMMRCSCGFYSARSFEHLMTMHYHMYDEGEQGQFRIMGRVANWGKVVECEQGWRAKKSYPLELFIPYEAWRLARPLSEAYGVPARLFNFLKPGHNNPL